MKMQDSAPNSKKMTKKQKQTELVLCESLGLLFNLKLVWHITKGSYDLGLPREPAWVPSLTLTGPWLAAL